MSDILVGRNAVQEALATGRAISKLLILASKQTAYSSLVKEAKRQGIVTRFVKEQELKAYEASKHQGIVAFVSAVEFQSLDMVLNDLEGTPLLLLLDEIEDPHNMGAIIRSAACAGATAVLIPKRHSAPINETVAKTSVGAIERIPLVQVGNVAQCIKSLQKAGFWVMGAHMDGPSMYDIDLTGPTVLVIGNEGKGLGRLTKESCDSLISIPMEGEMNSLNASVATGILLYEAFRQRHN